MNLETLEFVERVKGLYPDKFKKSVILEIGSLDVNGTVRTRQGLFESCDYFGIDLIAGKCVDQVIDYNDFKLDKKYDILLYLDVVEHDRFREKSFAKMWTDLKDDGIVIFVGSGPKCMPHFIPYSKDNYYANISVEWVKQVAERSSLNVELVEENEAQDQVYAILTKKIERVPVKDRPLISLVSMVKNEEGVLERMINSVKGIVDEFIIVDTGSTDSTKEIIKKYGKLYEMPFVNFVETKNECLKLATGEYILFMDADEVMYQGANVIREWAEGKQVQCLNCKITEGPSDNYGIVGLQYDRLRFWRNDGRWRFEGPGVHEVCCGPGPLVTDGRILVRHDHSNKAVEAFSIEKYQMWKRLLLEAIEKNQNDARAWFYLGRTEADLNNPLGAVSAFKRYLIIPNNNFLDERWQAAFDAGKQYRSLGELDKAIEFFDLAEHIDPRRREHLNAKAHIAFIRQDFEEAIAIYNIANSRPIPSVMLFLNPKEYTETTIDQLSLSNYFAKKYDVAESYALQESKQGHNSRVLNNVWWCRAKTQLKIFLTLGPTPEPVWGGMIDQTGVGGVETTYIELGRTLSNIGHDVFLFCNTEKYHVYGGVKYIPYTDYSDYINLFPDVTITSRWFESLKMTTGRKILWLQDANPLEANYDFSLCDKVIVSSQWHKDFIIHLTEHRISKGKLEVIPLGIDKKLFQSDIKRDPLHVVYSSNPQRGLDILADMWPEIEKRIPGIHLSVLYGWQGLQTWSAEDKWKKDIYDHEQLLYKRLKNFKVKFKGRVIKKQVADCLMSASLLVYPCNFFETFCLTGLEAQAAGAVVVTSDMGALHTTVDPTGNILLQGSPLTKMYQEEFIGCLEVLIKEQSQFKLRSVYNRNRVMEGQFDWEDIAHDWQKLMWDIL